MFTTCHASILPFRKYFFSLLFQNVSPLCKSKANTVPPEGSRHISAQLAERIVSEYGNSILRLAYAYLHNMADAEEVLQETLLRFLEKAPAFETAAHEKAWLLHVAGNLSKNRLVYNKGRSTDQLSESLAAEQREDLSFVWDAVKSLPTPYRETIHLFYYEGYSTEEISQILCQKESTVRSHLHRGREKLKKILKEAYDFEEQL